MLGGLADFLTIFCLLGKWLGSADGEKKLLKQVENHNSVRVPGTNSRKRLPEESSVLDCKKRPKPKNKKQRKYGQSKEVASHLKINPSFSFSMAPRK
jgi:hypothetical protein